jgi:hypothetical protein
MDLVRPSLAVPIKSTTFESATDIRYEIQVETSEDKPRIPARRLAELRSLALIG